MTDPRPAARFQWNTQGMMLIVSDAGGTVSLAIQVLQLPALGFQAQRFIAGERTKLEEPSSLTESECRGLSQGESIIW
jgi:hypothetical protein